jgi:hypothetical protein
MVGLNQLWLAILLSAVFVFIASSIIHMLSPWHKSDYPILPNQDRVMDALRALSIPAGDYMMPRPANRAEMKTPEFAEKVKRGPVVVMTIMPNASMAMGKTFVQWFLYCAIVSLFSAYITSRALPVAAVYLQVLRFAGATAFIGYSLALWQLSIWYHRSWSITIKATVDGLIYALITGATFGWLWPR